jgi:uncharacterized protein (TIGR00730 family)
VGTILAERGIDVVYGGGRVGLMGALADAALAAGGKVYGVIPEALKLREIAHDDVTELAVVPNMHVRKAQMAARSDAFLTLPGGVGTLEEFFEIFSWTTLGLIAKPLGILNINGYFNPLIALIDHAIGAGFMLPYHRDYLVVRDNPRQLIEDLLRFRPPRPGTKWIELQQT